MSARRTDTSTLEPASRPLKFIVFMAHITRVYRDQQVDDSKSRVFLTERVLCCKEQQALTGGIRLSARLVPRGFRFRRWRIPSTLGCLMDLDQLETFLEVARLSSFSRAAERRFRTQPAISSQIRAMEEEVGAKLLDRSGGKVSITAAGKIFQKWAEETLDSRKAVLTAIAEAERVPRGEIVVGANEGTCLHILPEVFADFKKQYPTVAVSIKRADYARVLESVIDNSVDFGVVSLPVSDNRLTAVLIHRDELVIIVPPQHPLAKAKSASVADVTKFPLLLPKAGHTRDALEELFHERKLKPHYSMELDSSELLKRFVAADVGVGFIARSNVLEDVRAGALRVISISDAQIRRDLALVFRKDKALSRAALAFIDIAVKLKTAQAATQNPS
jgi:DNA-binding transcriptional LysR family regulator